MKISKILISVCLALLLFAGCSKNENVTPNNNASNYSDDDNLKAPDGLRMLYVIPNMDEWGNIYG
jgi:PBP1b-binding outer membrane lipoprotein LpoB